MLRRIGILLVVTIIGVSLFYMAYAQTTGAKKNITLPSGEVIWDLNGEWDVLIENYGSWSHYGSYPQMVKITQNGSAFVGIRMIDDPWNPKGKESVRGELDKSGFRKVYIISGMGPLDSKGKISEDGNKFVVDDGEKARATYTRK